MSDVRFRNWTATIVVLVALMGGVCEAHGRLEEPAARNCAWRFGYKTPPNYNDNELNCGGVGQQWTTNGGKCGICGDAFNGLRNHEAGGKYATGTIVRVYETGQIFDVTVRLSANHLGTMEFRLCPVNQKYTEATQACLDENLLQIFGHGTAYPVKAHENLIHLKVKLPDDLTCSQCVLQWKYRAGNNWGSSPNGKSGLGLGPQEEFYNCADVEIRSSQVELSPSPVTEYIEPTEVTTTSTVTFVPTTTTTMRHPPLFGKKKPPKTTTSQPTTTASTTTTTTSTSTISTTTTSETEAEYELETIILSTTTTTTVEEVITPEREPNEPVYEVKVEGDDVPEDLEEDEESSEDEDEDDGEDEDESIDEEQTTRVTVTNDDTSDIAQIIQQLLANGDAVTTTTAPSPHSTTVSSFFHCERLPPSLVPFIETTPDPNEYKGIPLCLLIGDSSTTCKDCYEKCITPLKKCPREYCYCKWYV